VSQVLNSVTLVGRIATDVTLQYTPSGRPVAKFRLAVDRPAKDRENRKADFIPVVTWGAAAEAAAKYLQKGRLAAVRGRIQVREYTDKSGIRRWATEVVGIVSFLPDGRRNGQQAQASQPEPAVSDEDIEAAALEAGTDTPEDEDVPF
jgi:single-strand DNA-binding protein